MVRDLGAQMMLAEWLCVKTIDDLEGRSNTPGPRNRYELLGIAPLLRKLLLDSSALVDTIRAVRPEVATPFAIRRWEPSANSDPDLAYVLRLGGPELVGQADDPIRTIAEFVKTRVGQIDGEDLTVRQVVRYFSHVEGGVHFGVPKEPGEATWSKMSPVLLGNTTGQIEILAHLGRIVVRALTPLRDSILASPSIIVGMHHLNEAGFYDLHWTADRYRSVG